LVTGALYHKTRNFGAAFGVAFLIL
jgi:hypothetical protein